MSRYTPKPLVLEGELHLTLGYEPDITVVPEGGSWYDELSLEQLIERHFDAVSGMNGRYRITVERLS